jgi:hypothetical protein
MRSVDLGAVCMEELSVRFPDPEMKRRLSESAASAMAMLSLRCLFFTMLPSTQKRLLVGCETNGGQRE